jgi:hypothetical protein
VAIHLMDSFTENGLIVGLMEYVAAEIAFQFMDAISSYVMDNLQMLASCKEFVRAVQISKRVTTETNVLCLTLPLFADTL